MVERNRWHFRTICTLVAQTFQRNGPNFFRPNDPIDKIFEAWNFMRETCKNLFSSLEKGSIFKKSSCDVIFRLKKFAYDEHKKTRAKYCSCSVLSSAKSSRRAVQSASLQEFSKNCKFSSALSVWSNFKLSSFLLE